MKHRLIMNGIKISLRIYLRDMKTIMRNYVTLFIILGLIILPSLYAWFNISACWDPYSNTKSLSVALVNKDSGLMFKNRTINVGNDIVKKLKENQNIGWKFVNGNEADNGVKNGDYYASITITEGFSKDLFSVATEDVPKKAELIYSVNEKKNAIATKITDKGATSLRDEITRTFIQTASDTAFSYLNQFGDELEAGKPAVENLLNTINNLDQHMPEVGKNIDNAYTESLLLQKYLQNIQKDIPIVTDTLDKSIVLAKANDENQKQLQGMLSTLSTDVKESQAYVGSAIEGVQTFLEGAQDTATSIAETDHLEKSLAAAGNRMGEGIKRVDHSISVLKLLDNGLKRVGSKLSSIDGSSHNKVSDKVEKVINMLEDTRNSLADQQNAVNTMSADIGQAKKVAPEKINSVKQQVDTISASISKVNDSLNNDILPSIEGAAGSVAVISNNTTILLQNARDNMPLVNSLMEMAGLGMDSGVKDLKLTKDNFPEIQKEVHSNAEVLKKIADKNEYDKIVKMLKRDPGAESSFLSEPIEVKENKLYPIPNYGSAMAPFYTTLAIWVGAFILLSLLSVEAKSFEDGLEPRKLEQFFGRYLTIATISVLQAFVVTMGNVFLLKTYVLAPLTYILYGMYVSVIFTMIIYTLVSVFGNIGKAIAMVYMVLQVSASGGTFPIELTPSFFQHINPLLPFKYAIGGMRETVAGILIESLLYNAVALLVFFFVFLLIGILLKEKANKINEKFVHQFKGSGLAGE